MLTCTFGPLTVRIRCQFGEVSCITIDYLEQQAYAETERNLSNKFLFKIFCQELGELFIVLGGSEVTALGTLAGFYHPRPQGQGQVLVFEDEGRLHLVSLILAAERLHNGQHRPEAGPRRSAGTEASLLHAALWVAVVTTFIILSFAYKQSLEDCWAPCRLFLKPCF